MKLNTDSINRIFRHVKTASRTAAMCAVVVLFMHQNTSAGYGTQYAQFEQEMKSREALALEQKPYYVVEYKTDMADAVDVSDAQVYAIEDMLARHRHEEEQPENTENFEGEQTPAQSGQDESVVEVYEPEADENGQNTEPPSEEEDDTQAQAEYMSEYIWPVSGVITSNFGYRNISVGSSNHKGIDIAADCGEIISASRDGQVIYAQFNTGGYGYLVILQHEDGATTYYAHCSSLLVSEGEWVSQGQSIACVGSTGTSTGNHCHFEVRINDEPVNPVDYLPPEM